MRLFIAAWPSPEVTRILEGLERPEHDWIRWTPPSSWHVTIRFLGELEGPEEVIQRLEASGIALRDATYEDNPAPHPAARCPPPTQPAAQRQGLAGHEVAHAVATLGPTTKWFSGSRTLYAPVAGLDDLARRVAGATFDLGMQPGRFTGHITLARIRGRRPLTAEARHLAGAQLKGGWIVDEILAVSSLPGPEGSEYRVVERLRLL